MKNTSMIRCIRQKDRNKCKLCHVRIFIYRQRFDLSKAKSLHYAGVKIITMNAIR